MHLFNIWFTIIYRFLQTINILFNSKKMADETREYGVSIDCTTVSLFLSLSCKQ